MDTATWNREWVRADGSEEITEEERIAGEEEARAAVNEEFDALYAAPASPAGEEVTWTEGAFAVHDAAVAAVWSDTVRRYGQRVARQAECEASWIIWEHAQDIARADAHAIGESPVVTQAHVDLAAAAYRFTPRLSHRLSRIARIVADILTRKEATA